MNRPQLEHVLRAAAAITGADQFVIVGSQAILGQRQDPPPELLVSMEVDLFTLRSPEDADLVDGSIGEASPFHQTFGYYAHGVGKETAILPDGWEHRLVPFRTPRTAPATGLCIEVHDLAASKLAAAREKDLEYVAALLRHGLVDRGVMVARIAALPLPPPRRDACLAKFQQLASQRSDTSPGTAGG